MKSGSEQVQILHHSLKDQQKLDEVLQVITFGSVFSGIGGFDRGLEGVGFQCKWQIEIDDYATRVLEKHWPNVTRWRDARECGSHNLEWVNGICGGFPCQDISSLNPSRAGIHGPKSGLFFELVRIIRELRPEFVLLENVSDLLHRGLADVLGELASIGFDAVWESVPAAFVGLPQPRWRVLVVAYSRCSGLEGCNEWLKDRPQAIRRGEHDGLVQAERRAKDGPSFLSRVDDGLPNRVHRLRCLGNALPPQQAEFAARQVLNAYLKKDQQKLEVND